MELWTVGPNGSAEQGAGDDSKVMADVVTDIAGAYAFSNVPPGSYYVRDSFAAAFLLAGQHTGVGC